MDVEGMQLGIDEELVFLLGRWSPVPVTYAGGARTLVSPASPVFNRIIILRLDEVCSHEHYNFNII